jgi:hypothetical protein
VELTQGEQMFFGALLTRKHPAAHATEDRMEEAGRDAGYEDLGRRRQFSQFSPQVVRPPRNVRPVCAEVEIVVREQRLDGAELGGGAVREAGAGNLRPSMESNCPSPRSQWPESGRVLWT